MTIKEVIKNRYTNGQGKQAFIHIIEIVIAAGIVAILGIAYATTSAIPRVESRLDNAKHRMDRQYEAIDKLDKKFDSLAECVQKHMMDHSLHYPHKIVPTEKRK